MPVLYANNAASRLSASITNTATSFSVTSGQGALFPAITGSDVFYATLMDSAGNLEIVRVTARAADTFTVVRGQDGTTARAFSANDMVELRITKAMLDDLKGERLALTGGTLSGPVILSGTTATMLEILRPGSSANANMRFSNSVSTTFFGIGAQSGELRVGSTVDIYNTGNVVLHSGNFSSYSPSLTGSGASGTWGINITGNAGNAGTVGGLSTSQLFNNMGQNHSTYTDFNSVPNFGAYYVQAGTNSPTGVGAHQWYGFTLGLGNDYPLSQYATQLYWPRATQNSDTYIYVRDREGGNWGSWRKIRAGYADTAGSATDSTKLPLSGGTLAGGLQVGYGGGDLTIRSTAANDLGDLVWANYSGTEIHRLWDGGDGLNYRYNGGTGYKLLHAGNYTSYALPLGGGTMSGSILGGAGVSTLIRGQFNGVDRGQLYNDNSGMGLLSGAGSWALRVNDGTVNVNAFGAFNAAGAITQNGSQVLHAGNFTSYSPGLTGSGASGTWGINITGNAATVSSISSGQVTGALGYTPYPDSTPSGYSAGDINGNTTHQRLWGTDSVQDMLAFNPPTEVEYSTNGTTWVSTSIPGSVFTGKVNGAWGGFNMNVGNNVGAWRFVRLTWRNFGYRFWSHFTLAHSTNGHSFNFVFYKSDLSGNFGAAAFRQNGISSWPGYTFTKYSDVSGWWDTRDIRMVFELNHSGDANNAINIGHIGLMGSYGGFNRLFDWNASREMYFANAYITGSNHQVLHAGNFSSYALPLSGGTIEGTANVRTSVIKQYHYVRHIEGKNWDTYDTSASGLYLNYASNQPVYIGSSAHVALHAGNYTSYTGGLSTTNTWSGANFFLSNQNTASGANSAPLQAYSTGGNGAIMAFHRAGVYAINMGLDSDNVFRIGGWSASANRLQMDMSGNLTMAGNVAANSDERLKTDWAPVAANFIERLAAVKSGTYTRIDGGERQAGSSAQDWQQLLPEVVQAANDEQGTLSLAYGNAALVSAIELAKDNVELRARIERLESLIATLIGDQK